MKLTALNPRWLEFEGRRVGFIFQSPTDPKWWQTCFVEKFYLFKGRNGTVANDDDWCAPDSQSGIVEAYAPDAVNHFQGCNPDHQWIIAGGIESASFDTISVTPSLDGSAGGLWHGFITNGEVR